MIGKVAILSQCGLYRYFLSRIWDADLPAVLFIMLNPSTADAEVDDATIRKCIGFAKRWGCGSIHVVNLFAYRATDPRELAARITPGLIPALGPENSAHIVRALANANNTKDIAVAAWGHQPKKVLADRPLWLRCKTEVMNNIEVQCLGYTKATHQPRHPLMLPYATPLEPWP